MNRLVDYAETLNEFQNLGTDIEVAFKLKYHLKMLVFESHKIIYTIKKNTHTKYGHFLYLIFYNLIFTI